MSTRMIKYIFVNSVFPILRASFTDEPLSFAKIRFLFERRGIFLHQTSIDGSVSVPDAEKAMVNKICENLIFDRDFGICGKFCSDAVCKHRFK